MAGVMVKLDHPGGLFREVHDLLEDIGLADGPIPTHIVLGKKSALKVEFENDWRLFDTIIKLLNELSKTGNYVAQVAPSMDFNKGVTVLIGVPVKKDTLINIPGNC